MLTYLVQASLTVDAIRGTMQDGGTSRESALRSAISRLGGTLDAIFFSSGDYDVVALVATPDEVSKTDLVAAVGSCGIGYARTTMLLTPTQMDSVAQGR